VRLDARLTEAKIDPAEFCTAIAEHFKLWSKQAGCSKLTNMRQVSGDKGKGIWERWRKRRLAEGGVTDVQQENRVEAAAILGTMTEAEQISQGIRQAWDDCLREGVSSWTISLLWKPEVLWLLTTYEPSTRPTIRTITQQDSDLARKTLEGFAYIRTHPSRQSWLAALHSKVLGTRAPLLKREMPVADSGRATAPRVMMSQAWWDAQMRGDASDEPKLEDRGDRDE
jgi:hypothetical protein